MVTNWEKAWRQSSSILFLDACVAIYQSNLGEDSQVDFKGKAK